MLFSIAKICTTEILEISVIYIIPYYNLFKSLIYLLYYYQLKHCVQVMTGWATKNTEKFLNENLQFVVTKYRPAAAWKWIRMAQENERSYLNFLTRKMCTHPTVIHHTCKATNSHRFIPRNFLTKHFILQSFLMSTIRAIIFVHLQLEIRYFNGRST